MKKIDLHTHSSASDGSLSPRALMSRAKEMDLAAIALTDHDTVGGIREAAEAAAALHLEFIPGIELSVSYAHREIHIVGLFIDFENPSFLAQIQTVARAREVRNREMIARMHASGIDITPEKLYAEEGGDIITRGNFANYLVNHGVVSTHREAFDKYLDRGKPFYIPRKKLTPEDAVAAIRTAGGIPVMAHPLLYKFSETELEATVAHFTEIGIRAIEAYYSRNQAGDEARVKALAKRYGLLFSGGSDFHGAAKPDIELGRGTGNLSIPYTVLEKLKESRP